MFSANCYDAENPQATKEDGSARSSYRLCHLQGQFVLWYSYYSACRSTGLQMAAAKINAQNSNKSQVLKGSDLFVIRI